MDTRSGHIPDGLIYGPVLSRRFGRSLGVSPTPPACWTCTWRCPYCQLGNLPTQDPASAPWPSLPALNEAVQVALAGVKPGDIDVITVAGSGEPTLHPAAEALANLLATVARCLRARLILLTNGDGLLTSAGRAQLVHYDEVWIKHDPGPRDGCHRRLSAVEREQRCDLYRALRPLRIQAMVTSSVDRADGGSAGEAAQARWIDELRPFSPECVSLVTVDREPAGAGLRPLSPAALQAWAAVASQRLGCPVTAQG